MRSWITGTSTSSCVTRTDSGGVGEESTICAVEVVVLVVSTTNHGTPAMTNTPTQPSRRGCIMPSRQARMMPVLSALSYQLSVLSFQRSLFGFDTFGFQLSPFSSLGQLHLSAISVASKSGPSSKESEPES
jgi:hypothetical protein